MLYKDQYEANVSLFCGMPKVCHLCRLHFTQNDCCVLFTYDKKHFHFHQGCLMCKVCNQNVINDRTFYRDNSVFCNNHYNEKYQLNCSACNKCIRADDWCKIIGTNYFHISCLNCFHCKEHITDYIHCSFNNGYLFCGKHPELSQTQPVVKNKTRRARTHISRSKVKVLEECFNVEQIPNRARLSAIADMTSLSYRLVKVWHQNKRASERRISRNVAILGSKNIVSSNQK
ncbi:hypothetical protein A3Q56_01614 [Intoshia linei]|uniref:Uncharacterized protein n=1 Tax=Intoshia linei TaxID=1819745 RepID=A0A177B8M3_9BILA|nr:hypothetical protein A3Q56_01614 [Intoshia linei]